MIQDYHKQLYQAKMILLILLKNIEFDENLKYLNENVTSNKTKHVLVENESKKLRTFDSSLFVGSKLLC